MQDRSNGLFKRKSICSITLAAALAIGSVMPVCAAENTTNDSGDVPAYGTEIQDSRDIIDDEDIGREDTGRQQGLADDEGDVTSHEAGSDILPESSSEDNWQDVTDPIHISVPDGPSSDECFEGYINALFGLEQTRPDMFRKSRLSGDVKVFYDALKPLIKQVANGTITSSIFTIDHGLTLNQEGVEILLNALLADCPYDLYWFDKLSGLSLSGNEYQTIFYFSVSAEYSAGEYEVDPTAVNTAQAAVERTNSILQQYESLDDYSKLKGYKEEICNLVEYNHEAAWSPDDADSNAWQLIWVFDGDESTNVVCEGYAKAFQYLCDRTQFSENVNSNIVTGSMNLEAHMWNLVRMQNNKVYMADITNCDTGAIGEDELLFMAGCSSGTIAEGYVFRCSNTEVKYTYDSDTRNIYSNSDLTISDKRYLDDDDTPATIPDKWWGDCGWTLDEEGVLTVYEGVAGVKQTAPWKDQDIIASCTRIVLEDGVILPNDCSNLFYDCQNLLSIDISHADTSNVMDMSYMFDNCRALQVIELDGIDTSGVTNMDGMFARCPSLMELNVTGLNTSNVTNMRQMFYWCESLTELDLSSFDTSKVTDMFLMFGDCTGLTELDLSGFNTSKVNNMASMFSICVGLRSLNLSGFDTSSVTDMSEMFYACDHLTKLNISGFDTSKVKNFYQMFCYCMSLAVLDISGLNTSSAEDMGGMFFDCENLTELDVSGFNTSNVTNMKNMFAYCELLTSLDVTSFDTSEVSDMSNMFFGCQNLTSLDISGFDTLNVINMSHMFYQCINLAEIDVARFDTSNVTQMDSMFEDCTSVASLDVSSFDTSNVTNMSSMFLHTYSLNALDVTGFRTSNVTDMSGMFSGLGWYYRGTEGMSLDLSNFDTSKVENMTSMFQGCAFVPDLSGFNTTSVTNMSSMFSDFFFTDLLDLSSFDTSHVTDFSIMFGFSEGLTSLNLSHFNTSSAVDMSRMFDQSYNLTTLDISGFDTSNVTNMSMMFRGCDNLSTLILGENFAFLEQSLPLEYWESQSTGECYTSDQIFSERGNIADTYTKVKLNNWGYCFWDLEDGVLTVHEGRAGNADAAPWKEDDIWAECSEIVFDKTVVLPSVCRDLFLNCNQITNIDLSGVDSSDVETINSMFLGCSSLENVDLSSFDTSKVYDMSALFDDCYNLQRVVIGAGFTFMNDAMLPDKDWFSLLTEKVFTAQEIAEQRSNISDTYIEATPCIMDSHLWDPPVYEWSDDNMKVTAKRVCSRDETHVETETVMTTFILEVSPTETTMGETKYTSDFFENSAFTTQTKTVKDIPALMDLNVLAMPQQVTRIEEEAFMGAGCEALIIPDGCEYIGPHAFANCNHLIYVRIPASVLEISPDAFEGSEKIRFDRLAEGTELP